MLTAPPSASTGPPPPAGWRASCSEEHGVQPTLLVTLPSLLRAVDTDTRDGILGPVLIRCLPFGERPSCPPPGPRHLPAHHPRTRPPFSTPAPTLAASCSVLFWEQTPPPPWEAVPLCGSDLRFPLDEECGASLPDLLATGTSSGPLAAFGPRRLVPWLSRRVPHTFWRGTPVRPTREHFVTALKGTPSRHPRCRRREKGSPSHSHSPRPGFRFPAP